MRRLPFFTVVFLATGLLAWNFSFYREFYEAHAAGAATRRGVGPEQRRSAPSPLGQELASPPLEPLADAGRVADAARTGSATHRTPATDGPGPDLQRSADGARGTSNPGDRVERVLLRYPSGSPHAEGLREGGLRAGLWTEWYEEGRRYSQGRYKDDLRHGHWIYWYAGGQKMHEGDYAVGRREGDWRSWHENGHQKLRGRHLHGERDGLWGQYYSNGQIMESGRYVDGRREGWWEFYDYDGNGDRRTGWYENGRRVRD